MKNKNQIEKIVAIFTVFILLSLSFIGMITEEVKGQTELEKNEKECG